MPASGVLITVAGRIDDKGFQQAKVITENLMSVFPEVDLECVGMVETEWTEYINAKGRELGGEAYTHQKSPIVYYNGCNYVGGIAEYVEWVAKRYEYEDTTKPVLYERLASREYTSYLHDTGHQFVFLNIAIGKAKPQRVTLELYSDVAPKTCENFRALCTGEKGETEAGDNKVKLHYLNNLFHRIVKGGWVQGGDIVSKDCAGDGGHSIYGETFPDESFAVKQTGSGILAMANCGVHTNASQFIISLQKLEWLDTKMVAFGRVITGMAAIHEVAAVQTENERPVPDKECKIVGCGEWSPGKIEVPEAPNLFGGLDLRRRKTKTKNLDVRRRKTKMRLLKMIFEEMDKSGDGEIDKTELLAALKDPQSSLNIEFPKHVHEIPNIFEQLDTDKSGTVSWDEFIGGAMTALSAPGGR
jgi:peptidyl-prolyl cis-trans isomerase-like 6